MNAIGNAAASSNEAGATAESIGYRGVHHVVLNTDDMKKTIDFYTGVLGMPLVHAMKVPAGINRGNPPFERLRHYFFDLGNDTLLAFFELPKGAKGRADRNEVGALQHCAIGMKPSQVAELVRRLDAAGVERIGPMEAAPGVWSTYFYDPNGVRLEMSYQPAQGENQQNLPAFGQSKEKMLAELSTLSGDPAWLAWASASAQ